VRDLYQNEDPWVCSDPYQPRGSALIAAPYIRAMRKLKAINIYHPALVSRTCASMLGRLAVLV
jgi:hypothetical protein